MLNKRRDNQATTLRSVKREIDRIDRVLSGGLRVPLDLSQIALPLAIQHTYAPRNLTWIDDELPVDAAALVV
jgi:hypothetical protein